MKKIVSLVLIVMFIFVNFSFILNVKAETITVDETRPATVGGGYLITNTTTLTVTNLPSSEEKFAAYKILDAFYNKQTNEVTYEFTTDFKAFLAQSDEYKDLTVEQYQRFESGDIEAGGIHITSSKHELNYISSLYAMYIRANSLTGISMDTTGTITQTTVPAGSYLVLPTTNKYVYAVMVGNAELYGENGEWKIKQPKIVAKTDSIDLVTYITDHKFESPQEILTNMDKLYFERSFMINDDFLFGFNADVDYPYFKVNDLHRIEILYGEGVVFLGIDSMKFYEGVDGSQLRIDEEGNFYNSYDEMGVQKENLCGKITLEDNKIIIEYETFHYMSDNLLALLSLKLNENAKLGSSGNVITTKFYYANDPFDPNSEAVVEFSNTAYTYGIELQNYGDSTDKVVLNNSQFEVYSDKELKNKVGDITIIDGIGTLKGVAEGTYYLKQTKAPTGYKLSTDTISFEIDTTKEYTSLEIISAESGFLPSTGGIGTIIYTLIGLMVVGLSTLLIIKYRKRAYQI